MDSKYSQLAENLAGLIRNGSYPVGGKLPTEEKLAEMYSVSRQTVRLALSVLVRDGLISKKQGSGNSVISNGLHADLRSIAVLLSSTDDYIYPAIVNDLQAVLSYGGFNIKLFTTGNRVSAERMALTQIIEAPFSGILAEGVTTALPNPNLDLYQRLTKKNVPLVFIHGGCEGLEGSVCVSDDNYSGGYQLTRYLVSKGHTRIGGIFKSDDNQGRQRFMGYTAALLDTGLKVPDESIMWFSEEDRKDILERQNQNLLNNYIVSRLQGCSAVVAYNDEIAYYLILALLDAGRDVPGSVSVVSFDNSYYCGLSPIKLTSLGHDAEAVGGFAASCLLRLIEGKEARSVLVPWKLFERKSG